MFLPSVGNNKTNKTVRKCSDGTRTVQKQHVNVSRRGERAKPVSNEKLLKKKMIKQEIKNYN